MLEPQSTVLFVLLLVAFGGLLWWLAVSRRVTTKILAGSLSFLAAMLFGVLAVNRYFAYYQTWGAAIADLSNSSPTTTGPQLAAGSLLGGHGGTAVSSHTVFLKLARQQGYTLHVDLAGKLSHITRQGYVYLPPEYFQPQYRKYRFPVIELIHGQPGAPLDWINVVGVQVTLEDLVRRGLAKPVVLVMPDANGGTDISLQCLNQYHGPQDMTYLGTDVPHDIARLLRVQRPGKAWGIAGYSEGGFCAANLALHYRTTYGYAASLSGYFTPADNKLANPARLVNPFGPNRALRRANTPLDEVRALPAGTQLPQFWLGAGQADRQDVSNAEYFWQALQLHQVNVPLVLTPGGGHTMYTWHAEVPPMLSWMTVRLADQVTTPRTAIARATTSPSTAHTRSRTGHHRPSRT